MANKFFYTIVLVLICLNYSCKRSKHNPDEINKKIENSSYNYLIQKREINRGSLVLNDKHHLIIPSGTFKKHQSENDKMIYLKDIYPPYEIIKQKATYEILIVKNNDTLHFEIPKYE